METNFVTSVGALFGNIDFLPFTISALSGLLVLMVLLVLSALISGSEVALFSLEPKDLELLKSNKQCSAQLILELTGEIPALNEKVLCKNFTFQIEAVDRRRIKEIRVLINRMAEKK